jgi:hypothetical protein
MTWLRKPKPTKISKANGDDDDDDDDDKHTDT